MSSGEETALAIGERRAAVRANERLIVVDTVSAGKKDPRVPMCIHAPTVSDLELGESVLRALNRSRGHCIGSDDAPDLYPGPEALERAYQTWIDRLLQVGGYTTKRQLFKRMKHCSIASIQETGCIEIVPMHHFTLEGWTRLDRSTYVVVPANSPPVAVGQALRLALERSTDRTDQGTPPAVAAVTPPRRAPIRKRQSPVDTWLAYLTDGNEDDLAAVRAQWPARADGSVRTSASTLKVIEVLQSRGHALYVDWKDAYQAVVQAAKLARVRGLPAGELESELFDLPESTDATLAAIDRWLEAHGYRLLNIDTPDDDYAAVAVRAELMNDALALGRKFDPSLDPWPR